MTKLESGSLIGSSEVSAARLFESDHPDTRISVEAFDDGWEPGRARATFLTVRARKFRFLVTSHVSTCALAIADDINEAEILTFVAGATTDEISGKDDWMLRNIADVNAEQRSIAAFVGSIPGSRILIVRDTENGAYTTPAYKNFVAGLAGGPYANGIRLIDFKASDPQMDEFRAGFAGNGYDVLYLLIGGYKSVAGNIAQLSWNVRPDAVILFTPWMRTPDLLPAAGGALAGSIMATHYPARGEDARIDTYIERFKSFAGFAPTYISLNIYQALEILDAALTAGKSSPAAVKAWILAHGSFQTSLGSVVFDSFGDSSSELHFVRDIASEFDR